MRQIHGDPWVHNFYILSHKIQRSTFEIPWIFQIWSHLHLAGRMRKATSSCLLFRFSALAWETVCSWCQLERVFRLFARCFPSGAESLLQSLSALRCRLTRFPSSSHRALIRRGAVISRWPRCWCCISYWIINVFISRSAASPPHRPLLQNLLTSLFTTLFVSLLHIWPCSRADGLFPKWGDSLAKTRYSLIVGSKISQAHSKPPHSWIYLRSVQTETATSPPSICEAVLVATEDTYVVNLLTL